MFIGLIGCFSIIIVLIVILLAPAFIDALAVWTLVNLVIWAFGLNAIFTFSQAFVLGLIISFLQIKIEITKND